MRAGCTSEYRVVRLVSCDVMLVPCRWWYRTLMGGNMRRYDAYWLAARSEGCMGSTEIRFC